MRCRLFVANFVHQRVFFSFIWHAHKVTKVFYCWENTKFSFDVCSALSDRSSFVCLSADKITSQQSQTQQLSLWTPLHVLLHMWTLWIFLKQLSVFKKKSDVFSCCCVMLVPGTKTTRQCNHVRRYRQWFAAPYSHSNVLLTSWVKTILTLGFSAISDSY